MEVEPQVDKERRIQKVENGDDRGDGDSADDDIDKKDPAQEKQRLVKSDGKQQQENWNKAEKNHNVIEYMHYTNLATDQSNEIYD